MIVTDDLAKRLREKMKRQAQAKQLEAPLRAVRPVVQARHVTPQAPPVAAQLPPPEPVSAPAPAVRPPPPSSPSGGGGGGSWGAAPQQAAPAAPVATLVKRGQVGGGTGSANRRAQQQQMARDAVGKGGGGWRSAIADSFAGDAVRAAGQNEFVRGAGQGFVDAGGAATSLSKSAEYLTGALGGNMIQQLRGKDPENDPLLSAEDVESATRRVIPGNTFVDDAVVWGEQNIGPADIFVAARGPRIAASLADSPGLLAAGARAIATPVLTGSFPRRLLGEAAVTTGATLAARGAGEVLPEDTPAPVRLAAQLAAGLAGGAGAVGALKGADVAVRQADNALINAPVPRGIQNAAAERELGRMGAPTARLAGAAPTPEEVTQQTVVREEARKALLAKVREESAIRRSGVANLEIHEGRATQARGIESGMRSGMGEGLTGEQLVERTREGARTGRLRRTVAVAPDLTPEQRDTLFGEIAEQMQTGQLDDFEFMNVSRALSQTLAGEGLQPAQIRIMRRVFGNEIVDAAAVLPVRQTLRQEAAELAKAQKFLLQQENVLRTAAAKNLNDTLDALEIRDMRNMLASNVSPNSFRASISPKVERVRQKLVNEFNRMDAREAQRGQMEQAAAHAKMLRNEQRQAGQASAAQGRLLEQKDARYPNESQIMDRADRMISLKVPPESQKMARAVTAEWMYGNRVLLDAMGDNGNVIAEAVRGTFTGDLRDSFLTAMLHRSSDLDNALRMAGMDDPRWRSAVVRQLREAELNRRYGNAIPDDIRAFMEREGKFPPRSGSAAAVPGVQQAQLTHAAQRGSLAARGAAQFSQEMKNLMFGIGDVGVFGIQALAAVNSGGVAMLAGLVNRIAVLMHMPSVRTMYADAHLPKQIQYQLEGVGQTVRTGGVGNVEREGTLIQHIPIVGGAVDKPLSAAIGRLTDLQFGTVLGSMRNLIYEGDLVMAHLGGRNIANRVVRRTAADNANAITSYGRAALRGSRSTTERALLLSPSMVRARVNVASQMARTFSPTATAAERIVGATTILSYATAVLVIGKTVNDMIGVGDYEMDPSKPGFGNITLPNGTVFNPFPQSQFVKLIAGSARAISEADPKQAAEEWGKFIISMSSPAAVIVEKNLGFGFDPSTGYRFGDFGAGRSVKWRVFNMLPIPPLAQPWLLGGERSNLGVGLDVIGLQNFEEGGFAVAARIANDDPRFAGQELRDILSDSLSRSQFFASHPEAKAALDADTQRRGAAGDPDAQRQLRIDEEKDKYLQRQTALDAELASGEIDREKWREQNGDIRKEQAAAIAAIYGDKPRGEPKNAVDRYGAAIEGATSESGRIDWDEVDAWLAAQSVDDQKYIDDRTGLNGTPTQKEYRRVVNALDETRFFDITPHIWGLMQEAPGYESTRGFESYSDWYSEGIKDLTQRYQTEKGYSEAMALEAAVERIRKLPVYEMMSHNRNLTQQRWVAANPDLAEQARLWGYIDSFDKDEERILQEAASR